MFTTRPELTGTLGMVTASHWLSSQSGMAVLERGGNAFDAAVAAAFVLQVVQPDQNGPGGEVPIVAHHAATGDTFVVNGQGPSPATLTGDALRDLGVGYVPQDGHLPACVPAMFGTLTLLLERYGTMRLRDVLDYAIGYAGAGFPTTPLTSLVINDAQDRFRTHWHSTAEVYLPGGRVPAAGERFTNKPLAATFERVLHEAEARTPDRDGQIAAARDIWYRGFVADAIDKHLSVPAMDSTGTEHRGFLTGQDVAEWQPTIERPVTYDYHGYTLAKPQPWSQGPVLLQQLALLRGFDLAAMDPLGPDFIHTFVEAAKLAFADREAYYGDPDFTDVPIDHLLSAAYNDDRRRLITGTASGELVPGRINGKIPRLPRFVHEPLDPGGEHLPIPYIVPGSGRTNGDTVHIDVVDRWGNLASVTPSGGFLWGAPLVPDLGFAVGIRGQIFNLEAGLPNSIEPRKRPRTTLSPSLALRDGEPYMAFGTPGGDMQDQWPLIFLLNHIHHGMNLQEAVDSPTWNSLHFPSSFMARASSPKVVRVEARIPLATRNELERRGHIIDVSEEWSLGMTSAVTRTRDGQMRAGISPRGLLNYASGR
ncbi:gamma-glutamyltransferase family protein [Rhodococcus sp. T2V]|uniref:gamma-glutamyltransferase family protein n=1 Tax=Rhodococcus sp. T2V TaxID=3034164 RepID=UPI0023E0B862|nr:gamma-glutamyltransferase family protein [Rhodococcus sp. T2V]MDF3306242.1 gamma-glutamyltransferase family protein [Rhodococcus sp. T2V]